jgi:putative flippase GtrA
VITRERFFRFLRFCIVGGTVASIDFGLVWLLSGLTRPLVAVSIAYLIAVCCHFLLNKMWVFRCRRSDYIRQLVQYFTVVFASWSTTITIVHFCLSSFTHNLLIAKLFAIPPATLVGFLLMQLLVFRRPNKSTPVVSPVPDSLSRRP